MAQLLADGKDQSGTGLTVGTVNFGSIGSVNHNRPEVFYLIGQLFLLRGTPGSTIRRKGNVSPVIERTERKIGSITYSYEVQHYQALNIDSTIAPGFVFNIYNALTRALISSSAFHYTSFEAVNWSAVVGATLYP